MKNKIKKIAKKVSNKFGGRQSNTELSIQSSSNIQIISKNDNGLDKLNLSSENSIEHYQDRLYIRSETPSIEVYVSFLDRSVLQRGENDVMNSLVKCKELDILKFFVERHNIKPDQSNVNVAAGNGDIRMVTYLVKNLGLKVDQNALTEAIYNQQLIMIKFLVTECHVMPSKDCLSTAVNLGDKYILEYFADKYGIKPDASSLYLAVENNLPNIVELLVIKYKVKLERDLVRVAAENQNLDMLKCLIDDHGLMPDEDALISAIENQNLEILSWLHNKGLAFNISGSEAVLATKINPKVLKLCLLENPYLKINYSQLDSKIINVSYLYKLHAIAQVIDGYQVFPKDVKGLILDCLMISTIDFIPDDLKELSPDLHELYFNDNICLAGQS